MLKTFAALLLLMAPAWAQNPRHVVSGHPRLLINTTVTDTWQPPANRLAARSALALGGNATAVANFASLKALCTSTSPTFYNATDEGYLDMVMAYAYIYAIYHSAGQDSTANPYAQSLWNTYSTHYPAPIPVTSVVANAGTATVTTATPHGFTSGWGGLFAATDDTLNGGRNITVTSATTFTFSTTSTGTHTESGMWASQTYTGMDQTAQSGIALMSLAIYYDWCYDWLVANGHDQYILNLIKILYWNNTLTRSSSGFNNNVRESDFHNYTSKAEVGIAWAGIALYGDDPLGATMLDEGAGYLWEGITVQPSSNVADTFTFNVKASTDALTGGSMNWEGPSYWRSGAMRFIMGIEGFDSGTGRQNNIWTNQFPDAYKGAYYKIYVRLPDGSTAAFGDAGTGGSYAGRDNFAIAILNDRFPDPHFVWMVDNDVASNWDSGSGGFTGLVWKLIFYPYVNGPGSHDLTDLPPSAQFGTDIMIKDDWSANSMFLSYSGSLRGTYHRHEDAGNFTLYNRDYLVLNNPYTDSVSQTYYQYNRRTISGNTLTVYDPGDCWMLTATTCGLDVSGNKLVNDGGQLISWRGYNPPYATSEFRQNRAWSGSVYTDPSWSAVYTEIEPQTMPAFYAGADYEHIRHDLTKFYRNAYTGLGHNPTVKVDSNSGVVREIVHFHPTFGTLSPVVMFDRVTSANASFKKSWLMHTVNAPAVNGTTPNPGDTTTSGATLTQVDNGAGRLYVTHLLPASPTVRTVGGNACTAVPIQSATNANPAVYYAPAHGLTVGEGIRMDTGTVTTSSTNSQWWPNWGFDRTFGGSCGYASVATVPDADHFTITGCGSNSTSNQPWTTAFTSGAGSPSGTGAFTGQIYYQSDASPSGNNVWQWSGSAWVNLQTTGGVQGKSPVYGYTSPIIQSHTSCNYAYFVDQLGPSGSGSAHLWQASMDQTADDSRMKWLVQESPSSSNTTDYFLNVLTPATTSDAAPAVTQVTGTGVAGAVIADSAGSYVAAFPTAASAQSSLIYSASHPGSGRHIVSGLIPSATFSVGQNTAAQTTTPVMLAKPPSPQKVFLSTDVCTDIDDSQAIALLVWLHQQGYIQILGINADTQSATGYSGNGAWADAASFIKSFLTRASISTVPIGACPWGSCNWGEGDTYCKPTNDQLSSTRYRLADFTEGVALLRQVLAANPAGSVKLISVGPATRIAAFMQTPANYNGDGLPDGQTLWNKLQAYVPMGGRLKPSGGFEYNYAYENSSTPQGTSINYILTHNGSVPVYGNDANVAISTGGRAYYSLPPTSPLQAAFTHFSPGTSAFTLPPYPYTAYGYGRAVWDPSTALFAVLGTYDPGDNLGPYFTLSANGTISITVAPETSSFSTATQSNHYVITIARTDTRQIIEQIQQFDILPVLTKIVASDSSGAATFTETGGGTFGLTQVSVNILTDTSLPAGIQGMAYSRALSASGGSPAYTWSVVSGSLPAGLSLSSGGVISGTPLAFGASTFTLRATDVNGVAGTKQFTMTVQAPAVSTPPVRAGSQVRPGAVVR